MINIEVKGLDKLTRQIETLTESVSDLRPFWSEYVEEFIQNEVRDIFSEVYPGRLIRTGRYFRSVTQGSPDNINVQTPDSFVYGTLVPYVQYLESRFPVLTLLATDSDFLQGILRLGDKWIEDTIREAGL